jgi:anti-sigma factor RsiW
MAIDKQRLSEGDRANLVAYLDGELDEREEQAMATKLTQSVSGRREMESLQKTWEMLDLLPRPTAPDDFASRTLTEVEKLDLKGARFASAAGSVARRVAMVAASAAALLLSVATGYAATRWLWPDPTARLTRELPLAEHLDEFRDAGSFEFLELLDRSPTFNESQQ